MSLLDWSPTAANNTSKPGIDWSEGQLPGTVNGSARGMMADVASWLTTPTFPSASSLSVGGVTLAKTTDLAAYALLSGATFAGTITAPAIAVDANVKFFKPTATLVDVVFDASDVLRFDQSGNQWDFLLGGVSKLSINSTNMSVPLTLNATTLQNSGNQVWHAGNLTPSNYLTTANAASTYLTIANAASTYAALNSGPTFTGTVTAAGFSGPITLAAGITVRANSGKMIFTVGSTDVASLDSSGNLRVLGNITAAAGTL